MRVFVTGATGFIGTAIVKELLAAGHQVTGLARSETSAQWLTAAGAQVHRGDIEDIDSLHRGAAAADGVIHAAFNHDFSKFQQNCDNDWRAIEALGSALAGSERPLVITSGTALLTPGYPVTEQEPLPVNYSNPRMASELAAAAVAATGVRVSVVRLPPSVHGAGDHGFVPMLIALAREKGEAAFVADSANRWPAVHRVDAARLFRLVLEQGAQRANYHGNAEEGVAFRDIAGAIGRHLNLPVVSKTPEQAAGYFGWFAHFAAIDNPTSSQQTRDLLDWHPQQPGLLDDLDNAGYFSGPLA